MNPGVNAGWRDIRNKSGKIVRQTFMTRAESMNKKLCQVGEPWFGREGGSSARVNKQFDDIFFEVLVQICVLDRLR